MEIIAASTEADSFSELELAIRDLEALETMPVIAQRLLAVTAQQDCEMHEVQALVSADPALAARMMRLASAPVYGSRAAPNLRSALIRIGMRDIRRMVTAAALIQRHRPQKRGIRELWAYCLRCGSVAESLAARLPSTRIDDPFLLGLLHELGTFVLCSLRGAPYQKLLRGPGDEEQVLAEQAELGFDHTLVGALIAEQWNLFPGLEYVMQLHHTPLIADELALEPDIAAAVYVVGVARQYAGSALPTDAALHGALCERLGIGAEQVLDAARDGMARYESLYASLLGAR